MRRLRKAVSILAGLVAAIAIVVYFIFQLPEFGGRFESKRLERMRRSPEFIGGRFENTHPGRLIRHSLRFTDSKVPVVFEPQVQFKLRIPLAVGLIRTGDTTQYANLILESAEPGRNRQSFGS